VRVLFPGETLSAFIPSVHADLFAGLTRRDYTYGALKSTSVSRVEWFSSDDELSLRLRLKAALKFPILINDGVNEN